MTREEAKNFLIGISYDLGNMSVEYLSEKDGQKMREAIKTLEQEPSGDLISRKALISHIENQSREWGEDYDAQQILGDIEDMPSVKPQEPCEEWYDVPSDEMTLEQARQAVRDLRKKLAEHLEQEPTGHWIEHPEIETSTPEYLMFYECSECGDKQCFCKSDIHKKHFCNNCGARMVEPKLSENPTGSESAE